MNPATLVPESLVNPIAAAKPILHLDASRGVGTTGARLLVQARGESFVGAQVPGHGTNDIAISAWCYPVSTPSTQATFVFYSGGNGATYPGVCFRVNTSTRAVSFYFATGVDGTNVATTAYSNTIPLNTWSHLFGYVDRVNKRLYLYINGVLVKSDSYSGNDSSFANSSYMAIGGMSGLPYDYRFDGRLSRCGYFLGTLDHAAAADHLWNQGNGRFWAEVTQADLVAAGKHYYNLNESSLSNAIDAIGTNDCVITATNLLTNPGFETLGTGTGTPPDTFAGWTEAPTSPATVTDGTTNARTGSHCACLYSPAGEYVAVVALPQPHVAGRRYTASWYAKSAIAGGVQLEEAGVPGQQDTGVSYVQKSVTYTPAAASFTLKRTTSGTFYFDDVSLTSAQIDSAAGPREATAADVQGGYHGVLTNMDTVGAWSTDTPDGSYTATKVDSVGTAHGTMTGFTDIDAAHVDGPDGAWGPYIPDNGSSPSDAWLLSSVKDSRSANVPRSLNTRIFDEYYTEPTATGSRSFTGTQYLSGIDIWDAPGDTVASFGGWIYPTNVAATRVIATSSGSVSTSPGWKFELTSAHQLNLTIRTSTPVSGGLYWTTAIPLYQWHHVGFTINATTGLCCFYLNGALVYSNTISLGGSLFESGANWIGNYGTGQSFEGGIACVAHHNTIEWSVSDFQTLFNGGKARKYAALPAAMKARINVAFDLDGSGSEFDEVGGTKTLTVSNGPISTGPSPYLPAFDATLTGFTSSPRSSDVPSVLVGKCKSIQGATDKYATTGVKTVTGMGARSISFWFKRNGNPAANEFIVNEGQTSIGAGFRSYMGTDGRIQASIGNGAATVVSDASLYSNAGFADNAWHHCVVTWDGTTTAGKAIVYIDGSPNGNTATATATNQGGASQYSLQFPGVNGTTVAGFTGLICLPQVFAGRALTAGEVSTLYAGGDVTEGLTAEWRFNEPDAITVPFEHALKSSATAVTMVDCGHEMIGTGAVTVSGWSQINSLGGSGDGRICSNGKFFLNCNHSSGAMYASSSTGAGAIIADVTPGTGWNHFAFVRDATGFAQLFLNGNKVPIRQSSTLAAGVPLVGTNTLRIANDVTTGKAADGLIGQVRIDSGVLTQAQIRQLALGQSPATPTHDYTFDAPLDLPYLDGCRAIGNAASGVITTGVVPILGPGVSTLTAWTRKSVAPGATAYIVNNGGSGSSYRGMSFWFNATGNAVLGISDGTTFKTAISPSAITDGAWHHLAGVFDPATDTLRLYVDGVLATTTAVTEFESLGTPNVVPLTIGGTTDNNYRSITPDGAVADVRAYNGAALTQSQIRSLISGTDYVTGLSARWKFGETPRSIPSCAGGYSLEFNAASSNYVETPSDSLALTQLTFAGWFKTINTTLAYLAAHNGTNAIYIYKSASGFKAAFDTADQTYANVFNDVGSFNVGEWTHVALTYKSGEAQFYVNGVAVGALVTSRTGNLTWDSPGGFWFGRQISNYYSGKLDDWRVYGVALPASDIALLAAGGEPTTNPVAHWPFDDGPQYGEPSNGDPICVWEDRNGINFVQANTVNRPTYLQSGVNGRPGITFDGVQQYLASAGWIPNDPYGTLVVATKLNAAQQGAIMGSSIQGTGTYEFQMGVYGSGQPWIYQRAADTANAVKNDSYPLGTSAVRILTLRSDGSLYDARLDGGRVPLIAFGSTNNGDWFADTPGRTNFTLGVHNASSFANFLAGTIYEILYFPRPLSDVELRKVERVLGAKYGVTVA
jgi:hypothetical protein